MKPLIKQYDEKVTAKQFAKVAVLNKLINLKEYWAEYWRWDVEDMSDKEKQAIQEHIQKYLDRICKYLG